MNWSPNLSGSLEDWLECQLARHVEWFRERTTIVDVGAFHGDFTARFLNTKPNLFSRAILFEPNPQNYAVLERDLGPDKRVRLERFACGDSSGAGKLVSQGEGYTGSLLERRQDRPGARNDYEVKIVTLDEYLSSKGHSGSAGIFKVDTQGNDLRALRGGIGELRKSRPWIVVEMLATPRFVNQASPAEIAQFLETENYFLAAEMNEHYTSTGWLAWFDACFVPRELFSMDMNSNIARPSAGQPRKKGLKRFFQSD
jgi:FkbM family methyltransferase